MCMLKNKAIKWIVVIVLLIIVTVMLFSFTLRIFVRWGGAFISFTAVACVFYAFLNIKELFPSLVKKTRKKYFLTACLIIMCVFIYYEFNKPKVVRMKEDVIYILPKSDTLKKNKIKKLVYK
jgi:hypothetical protein